MMSVFMVYAFTRLDSIKALFVFSAIVSLLGVIVASGVLSISLSDGNSVRSEPWWQSTKKWLVRGVFVSVASLTFCSLIPSTKDMAAIYFLPKIANNEQVQQVPDKALHLFNAKLDEWINDIRNKEGHKDK